MARRTLDIDPRNGQIRIDFEYDRGLVERIKALPRRRWSPQDRAWFAPAEDCRDVAVALRDQKFLVSPEFLALFGDFAADWWPEAFPPPPPPPSEDEPPTPLVPPKPPTITPSTLNARVRMALTRAFPEDLWVVGEVSGWDRSASRRRNVFFELVEQEEGADSPSARVGCVIFDNERRRVEAALLEAGSVELADGVQVCVQCRVDFYAPQGRFQLIVRDIDPYHTLGVLAQQRDAVLRHLRDTGLAERNLAVPLPQVPLRIGLLTSLNSDAYNDLLNELHSSGWAFDVLVYDAHMQGRHLERTVLAGLRWFAHYRDHLDLIAIVRGGGSRTDLAWFDTVAIGEAACRHPLPILCGIGHHQDRSVLDAVTRSFKTPTAVGSFLAERVADFNAALGEHGAEVALAAERRLSRSGDDLRQLSHRMAAAARLQVERADGDLAQTWQRVAASARRQLERADSSLHYTRQRVAAAARARLRQDRRELDQAAERLPDAARRRIARDRTLAELTRRLRVAARAALQRQRAEIDRADATTRALHPRSLLHRGFALVRGPEGRLLRRPQDAPDGATLTVELSEGTLLVARLPDPTEPP